MNKFVKVLFNIKKSHHQRVNKYKALQGSIPSFKTYSMRFLMSGHSVF